MVIPTYNFSMQSHAQKIALSFALKAVLVIQGWTQNTMAYIALEQEVHQQQLMLEYLIDFSSDTVDGKVKPPKTAT